MTMKDGHGEEGRTVGELLGDVLSSARHQMGGQHGIARRTFTICDYPDLQTASLICSDPKTDLSSDGIFVHMRAYFEERVLKESYRVAR